MPGFSLVIINSQWGMSLAGTVQLHFLCLSCLCAAILPPQSVLRFSSAGSMLGQRLRRCPNIKPTPDLTSRVFPPGSSLVGPGFVVNRSQSLKIIHIHASGNEQLLTLI